MPDGWVRYARNGSVRLAYREFGQGDTALVWNPGWFSNVDVVDDPAGPAATITERLAAATRLIVWDKRGTGLSDPATHVPPLDERMDDLHAVLDAAEVERPALFGMSEGGPMSLLFAATYPERVQSLVMYGVVARFSQELPHCPWGFTAEEKASIWTLSKIIGVKARLLSCSSARLLTYPDFRNSTGGISGQAPARRWRHGCGRRSWRSMFAGFSAPSAP